VGGHSKWRPQSARKCQGSPHTKTGRRVHPRMVMLLCHYAVMQLTATASLSYVRINVKLSRPGLTKQHRTHRTGEYRRFWSLLQGKALTSPPPGHACMVHHYVYTALVTSILHKGTLNVQGTAVPSADMHRHYGALGALGAGGVAPLFLT
jgi:hypothetical protein